MEPFARLSQLPSGTLADVEAEPLPPSLAAWISALPEELLTIVSRVAEQGHGVWVVGGPVRDGLSGRIPIDFDLTSTMEPEEVLDLFPDSIPTGVDFGTVTVRTESGGAQFDLTTLRSDQEYLDGRRPESVDFGTSLSEDLERRDLTINAMAIDLSRCLLHDPHGGLADLEARVLRAVGEASSRLSEDGLRIMRVYRFMDQAEAGLWQPDAELSSALIECQSMLEKVSVERIWHELTRILQGVHASDVLSRISTDGLLKTLLPSSGGLESQQSLQGTDDPVQARLSLLFHPRSGRDDLLALKAPNRVIDGIGDLLLRLGRLPDPSNQSELRIYRASLGSRLNLQLSCETALDSNSTERVRAALDSLSASRAGDSPLGDGNWISEKTGLEPGIRLGRLKAWLHRIQVAENLATLDEIETRLSELDWQDGDPEEWPRVVWP